MITLIQSILVLFAATLRFRSGFLCFVFLLPFMPRYLGIAIGDGSFSARRISMILLVLIFSFWILHKHKLNEMVRLIKSASGIFSVLAIFFLVKIISTLNGSGISNLLFLADDLLFSVIILLMTMMLIRMDGERIQLLGVIVASLLVSEVLSIVEFVKQAPIMQGIIDVQVQGGDKIIEGFMRDGQYRAAALFDNPLLLSNFVCIAWPISWFVYRSAPSQILKFVGLLSLLIVPAALFFVASRAGWIILALTIVTMISLRYWHRFNGYLRFIFVMFICAMLAALFYGALSVFQSPTEFFSNSEQTGISALERINQYKKVADAFIEHPLIGYGTQQNIASDLQFLEHMDSYWLRLIIEGGLIALTAFVIVIWFVYRRLKVLGRLVYMPRDKQLIVALISSILAFVTNLFFIAIPTNNIYFYIFIGVLVGWKIERDEQDQAKQNTNNP